ncbi:hypothetical protein B0A48_05441 [Cryoendolithus antarcticus]|uniref:Cep57 centrosome microtubule-binding domain-containing protein n=1 Tax=Cryoendolithus antarcticus TaxID=1507870 RepID=A0A1V8TII0_9PEZI|nr:hypothetical protein B0A48_05441 [Cryoendolithus antarcticus]
MSDDGHDNTGGSMDMSIEQGRGGARGAGQNEFSEDRVWAFSNADSQYDMTPPARTRPRKSDGTLRREASVRKASEVAKPNASVKRSVSAAVPRQPSLAEAIKHNNALPGREDTHTGGNVTRPTRNTRFGNRVLSGSTLEGSNGEVRNGNKITASNKDATTQDVSETTFALPDMEGATQLYGGTPAMTRPVKRPTRFTPSAAFRMPSRSTAVEYRNLSGIPLDRDAERVFDGINDAVSRVAQLELEVGRLRDALADREFEISDLNSRLEIEQQSHRPDSGLGSEDEGAKLQWRRERLQLQGQIKGLRDSLAKAERQTRTHESTVLRVTQERMDVAAQCERLTRDLEDTKRENEVFRENYSRMQDENEELWEELAELREKVPGKRPRSTKRKSAPVQLEVEATENQTIEKPQSASARQSRQPQAIRAIDHTEQQATQSQSQDVTFGQLDQTARNNIAKVVQRELQRVQGASTMVSQAAREQHSRKVDAVRPIIAPQRKLSQKTDRRASGLVNRHRSVSAPVEAGLSDADFETDGQITERTRRGADDATNTKNKTARTTTRDVTNLSMGAVPTKDLRQMLEQQRRPSGMKRHASIPAETAHEATTTLGARRKSSMRDIAADLTARSNAQAESDSTTKQAKNVRVQTPHTSDDTIEPPTKTGADLDASLISSTPLPRPRIPLNDQTSAFLVPEITLREANLAAPPHTTIPPHTSDNCTVCPGSVPQLTNPIPVSAREGLPEDATLRPAWEPATSLSHVLKALTDELAHLHLTLGAKQADLRAHDPALGRRRRLALESDVVKLQGQIAKQGEVIYRLYDVVEGFKGQFATAEDGDLTREVEETLQSLGIDLAELSGRVGRGVTVEDEGDEFEVGGETDGEGEEVWEGIGEESDESDGEMGRL